MRVQSNNLPDYCYTAMYNAPIDPKKIDYTMLWNPNVTSATKRTFSSQSDYDNASCRIQKTSTLPQTSSFTENASGDSKSINYDSYAGMSINGISILSSASGDQVDPFYPGSWSGALKVTAETVDACLGHPMMIGNVYHYHILPPCLVSKSSINASQSCTDVSDCNKDIKTYALNAFANY